MPLDPIALIPLKYAERELAGLKGLNAYIAQQYADAIANKSLPAGAFVPSQQYIEWMMGQGFPGFDFADANRLGAQVEQLSVRCFNVAALTAWSYTKNVFAYDDALLDALIGTELSGDIPVDALKRLPEWCVYVGFPQARDLPGSLAGCLGFFAFRDCVAPDREELMIIPVLASGETELFQLPLVKDRNCLEALHSIDDPLNDPDSAIDPEWKQLAQGMARKIESMDLYRQVASALQPFLSILLYLCSDAPEIDLDRQPGQSYRPYSPQFVKTKGGLKLFQADKVRIMGVGTKIGKQLREAVAHEGHAGSHASKRTHVRRGHWHGFWKGPRKTDSREFIYRWIPPLVVNG